MFDTVLQDLRYAIRLLAKKPGFTAAAVVTLTLGIGANTAIFSVVNAVLLRPLPYQDPDNLVVFWEASRAQSLPKMVLSPPNFHDYRGQNTVFDRLAVYDPVDLNLVAEGTAEQLRGVRVSGDLFPLLGVAPHTGRFIEPADDQPGAQGVVVLSHALWQRRFGGSPSIVGSSLNLSGQPRTVVGITPPAFNFPPPIAMEGVPPSLQTDVWVPWQLDYASGQRGARFLTAVARLKPGVSRQAAEANVVAIASRLEQQYPQWNQGWTARLVPMSTEVLGDVRPALLLLAASVGLVLLIACANVANLLLARAVSRQREIATRVALGAPRSRLVRQLLTESLLLAAAGGLGGLLLATWGIEFLIGIAPNIPRLEEVAVDGQAAMATLIISLLTGLLFGLVPALQTHTARLYEFLKEGGRGGSDGPGRHRLQNALVVAEVALSLVLLVGAGLLLKSLMRLQAVDPGFKTENVLTVRVSLPSAQYRTAGERAAFFEKALPLLEALPGVEQAGLSTDIPIADDRQGTGLQPEGRPPDVAEQAGPVGFSFVSPDYFETLGIRVVEGRAFTAQDRADSAPVVIVNEATARRHFPGGSAVGKRVFMGFSTQTPREVVGVVADERHLTLGEAAAPNVYLPYFQVPWSRPVRLAFWTQMEPTALASSARRVIQSLDAALPIYDLRSMPQVVASSVARPRFSAVLLAIFAAVAFLLSAVGIYGVISYAAGQRTQEVGIRMALGAEREDIVRMVVRQGMLVAGAGIGVGMVAAMALTRLVAGLLYEVDPLDGTILLAIPALLAAAALLASYLPARRAARVDPIVALRCE